MARYLVVGNTTVDVLADFHDQFDMRPVAQPYVYATLHRREFTSSVERMRLVFGALSEIAAKHCPVILPLHPRTRDAVDRAGLRVHTRKITIVAPMQPFQSLCYQKHAVAILTDSGCVQEEAYMLRVPCVTIRDNTERMLTVTNQANRITGFDRRSILSAFEWASNLTQRDWPEIYGRYGVGERIVAIINRELAAPREPLEPLAINARLRRSVRS